MEKRVETTIMENRMEKKMENEVETGIIMVLGLETWWTRITWLATCNVL